MNIILGIDPDSTAHGVAIYADGKLSKLELMPLLRIHEWLSSALNLHQVTVHIEDVCANNAAFSKSFVKNAKAATAINRSLGKCQQAQVELERVFESFGVKVVNHKISKMWKDQSGKKQFEKVTGWTGRSNEDTRSAAWFGFLGLK